MDPNKFREAYDRLQFLDDRLTHKIRPRSGSMHRGNLDQVEEKLKDLAEFTVELKEILEELFISISSTPEQGE